MFHVRSVTQGDVIRADVKDIPRIFQVCLDILLHIKCFRIFFALLIINEKSERVNYIVVYERGGLKACLETCKTSLLDLDLNLTVGTLSKPNEL